MWLGTTTPAVCSLVEIVRMCQRASISRWLPYPRGWSGGRLLVHARLQGVRARSLHLSAAKHMSGLCGCRAQQLVCFRMAGLESCGFYL
jgi:hypothetical protein